MASTRARKAVVVRVAGRTLAIPVERTVEILRPPAPLLGTARIRGADCVVVDARRLLAIAPASEAADEPASEPAGKRRLVVMRGRGRWADAAVALLVDAVLDVRDAAGELIADGDAACELLGDACWLSETAIRTADDREKNASGLHAAAEPTE